MRREAVSVCDVDMSEFADLLPILGSRLEKPNKKSRKIIDNRKKRRRFISILTFNVVQDRLYL